METEIICISSDDESDSQKENRKKTSLAISTEICNTSLVHAKIEISANDDEKMEENNLKRKISEIDEEERSPSCNNMEKKMKLDKKLNACQNMSEKDKNSFATANSIPQSNKDQEVTIEKPKLIVKERKRISYITHDIFPLFISLCLQKCHDNDMKKIVNKLKRRYEELDPAYASSEHFALFLNEKREAIINDKIDKKLYMYIQDVMNEMKTRAKKAHASRNSETYDAVPSTSYATNNLLANNAAESDYEDDNENIENTVSPETRRKLKQLSKAMKKCESIIKKLEETEVNFDDEADSNYIKVERYKQRMVELYNKYCELTGENADAGRAYLRPKHISTTRIVAVDQAITNFINSKISKRNQSKKLGVFTDNLIFPDYRDILECVSRCNDKRNLGLDKRKQEQMAKKAFIELGEYLQRARRNDYWDTFSLYLDNTEEDPAIKDMELARKLTDNRSEGEKRLTAVFEKFTKKQEEMKAQFNDGDTTTEEENEEESSTDDDDKSKDNLSLDSLSDEDESEENVDKMVNENRSLAEKIKNININANKNINVDKDINVDESINVDKNINVNQKMDQVISSKIKTDMQERCNKNIEINNSAKENSIAVPENKTPGKEKVCRLATSNAVVITKNVTTDTKTPEDVLPISSTGCTSTVDRTEEDVAEMVTEDVSEVITNSIITEAEILTGNEVEVITEDVAEVTTGDVAEAITGDVTEALTGNVTEVITGDLTEVITEETRKITIKNVPSDKQPEEEKKPLLRVRSFAKPPTTWEDGRHKTDKPAQASAPKEANQTKDVIDLTNESSVSKPVITKCAIQFGNKIVPVVKGKHQTLVIPSGSNIISVQNITNNYLKVDTRTGQIIAPVRDIHGSTIIRMPSTQTITARQNQPQSANIAATRTDMSSRRNETILRIIQPNKAIVVSKKSTAPATSKQVNAHSTPKPK